MVTDKILNEIRESRWGYFYNLTVRYGSDVVDELLEKKIIQRYGTKWMIVERD